MDLVLYVKELFYKFGYTIPNNKHGVTLDNFAVLIANKTDKCHLEYGYSLGGWAKFIKKVFPDKNNQSKYLHFLLLKDGKKICSKCGALLNIDDFWKDSTRLAGCNDYCKSCMKPLNREAHRSVTAKYNASKLNRTPVWANLEEIKRFYDNCPDGYQVDHIIPLQGKLVSGLHVHTNLQYLTPEENRIKSNTFKLE
jgi:hypothetical protein